VLSLQSLSTTPDYSYFNYWVAKVHYIYIQNTKKNQRYDLQIFSVWSFQFIMFFETQSFNQKMTFFFFFCHTGVWTQGLYLEPLHQPFFVIFFFFFKIGSRKPDWLWTSILLISASWIAQITVVSHQCPARQALLPFEPLLQPFFVKGFFQDRVLWNYLPGLALNLNTLDL
jgi:hypothetical protein